ncbi:hypothetical protein Pcinc_013066 [Petrolisthes cinctipes]|uniref:Uncharacterized protein n=1 Tax=Petrolisthes cinctipes TaxID=88211 RepID=A0AAE1FXR2_PETCI|nr:hypothetical protein Pcinc_013066 [Petrolisthes cinctipes]
MQGGRSLGVRGDARYEPTYKPTSLAGQPRSGSQANMSQKKLISFFPDTLAILMKAAGVLVIAEAKEAEPPPANSQSVGREGPLKVSRIGAHQIDAGLLTTGKLKATRNQDEGRDKDNV